MRVVVDWMERLQVPLYLTALVASAIIGLAAPAVADPAEFAVQPVLALLLYATFLGVPVARLRHALRDWRFLAATLSVNFVVAPLVVFALSRFVASDQALLVGVLFVLLTPCVDYVIVFTGLAGGAQDRLLAAAPLLLLGQMLLLPLYLWWFVGADFARSIDPDPFARAFLLLIALPLAAAWLTQFGAVRSPAIRRLQATVLGSMVPLMMLTLGVVTLSIATTCLIFFTDFGGNRNHGWDALETWMWGIGLISSALLFVIVESRAEDPIIPLSLFKNPIFLNATAIGFTLGLGMFSAIAFVPTFLQMSSGTSAAVSGLLMLPMMVGMMGTSIWSGIMITKRQKYRMYPIVGTLVTAAAMGAMTTLAATTPIWLICVYLFVFGAGLGLIMQVVVLVVQNAVDATVVVTATSTNNYFREVGASLGVAIFGAMFTTRLSDNLGAVFTGAGMANAEEAVATIDPQTLAQMPADVQSGVVNAYADSLAPVFWYLIPFILLAFLLALFLKQIPLSDQSGMVARGEAIGGQEAEDLAAEQAAAHTASTARNADPDQESPAPQAR